MLSENTKKLIRSYHQQIAAKLPGYRTRPSQNFLVAEIAKTLAGEYHKHQRIAVIEAGTGTGKSLAYCLGTLPYALANKKKVVISTATVALQEQLISKELPFLLSNTELSFKFELVKGRQRYICAHKLASLLNSEAQQGFEFQLLLENPLSDKEQQQLQKLADAYNKGQWQGDRDSWPEPINDALWRAIVSDKHACQRQLKQHAACPYHQSRNTLAQADVLVINHSVLLADLELGAGTILPEPDNCIYIIDEAHHLPHVARDFSAASSTLLATSEWLEKLTKFNQKLVNTIKSSKAIGANIQVAESVVEIVRDLKTLHQYFADNYFEYNDDNVHRFANGSLPDTLTPKIEDLKEASSKLFKMLGKMHDVLVQDIADGDVKHAVGEPVLAESGQYLSRLEGFAKLWANLTLQKTIPHARWMKQLEYKNHVDFMLADSPIEVGFYLKDKLWQECAGAVLCSATLSALGNFDHFAVQSGLKGEEGVKFFKVASPFDYPNQARLHIPNLSVEPTSASFTKELITVLPKYIDKKQANLVLFASYWQMNEVVAGLRKKGYSMLVQGEASRDALLTLHKEQVKNGKGSILMGTQSFSEGLDLPGDFLTNLIITKIPFAVPTSPVEQAQSEYIESKGGNPFLSITVPDAAKKLVQSCGRLLRNESDTGTITILDRRLVSKRYGKAMLDSLPPFKRIID